MTILDRLTARSSRSLAVMIGQGQSGEARGRRARRGSPQGAGLPSPPSAFLPPFFFLPSTP
jgi:hypothetical protein